MSSVSSDGTSKSEKLTNVPIESLLPANVLKYLQDKLYDRRKAAATEIEKIVRDSADKPGFKMKVLALIAKLYESYIMSKSPNARKGGLMAVGFIAIGLTEKRIAEFSDSLIPQVLTCFTDQDHEVRFSSLEALYNITKVARENVFPYFSSIFDGICTFANAKDESTAGAALILDRLLKGIFTGSPTIDVAAFADLVETRIHAGLLILLPTKSRYLSWIELMSQVPSVELVPYFPKIVNGMMDALSDESPEVAGVAVRILNSFLNDMEKGDQMCDHATLLSKLLKYTDSQNWAAVNMALKYCKLLFSQNKDLVDTYVAQGLLAVLPLGMDAGNDKAEAKTNGKLAAEINEILMAEFLDSGSEPNIEEIVNSFKRNLDDEEKSSEYLKKSSMRWLQLLNKKYPQRILPYLQGMFPYLLQVLHGENTEIIQLSLEIISYISENELYFSLFLSSILEMLKEDKKMLEERGEFIIRVLCKQIGDNRVYQYLSRILSGERNLKFARTIVRMLNLILFRAEETAGMRKCLQRLNVVSNKDDIFLVIYPSWCHDFTSLLTLCLFSNQYTMACSIMKEYTMNEEIDYQLLVEMDKLVQLVESPQFLKLRTHMLEPFNYPTLHYTLSALLQFFPQNEAFNVLNRRLSCTKIFLNSGIMPIFSKDDIFKKEKSVNIFSPGEVKKLTELFAEFRVKHKNM